MNFNEWLKKHRSLRVRELILKLNSKLRGYYNYYGVIGNARSLWQFDFHVVRQLRKWLSRRSQRGKVSWRRMNGIMDYHCLAKPRINENPYARTPWDAVHLY